MTRPDALKSVTGYIISNPSHISNREGQRFLPVSRKPLRRTIDSRRRSAQCVLTSSSAAVFQKQRCGEVGSLFASVGIPRGGIARLVPSPSTDTMTQ